MRFPRVKPDTHSFYHCISRVVEGRFIFAIRHGRSIEAEKLIAIMRPLEAFSGVRVLDYVIMANHFHLVFEVPEPGQRALPDSKRSFCPTAEFRPAGSPSALAHPFRVTYRRRSSIFTWHA